MTTSDRDEERSTLAGLRTDVGERRPTRYWLHTTTTVVLTAIIGVALLDGLGLVDVFGVDTASVRATGGGYDLEVRYGTVSRPALATPFEIVVGRPGGFDGPVTVAVAADYLAMWDENGLVPAPASETTDGAWVLWEFDPPNGDELRIAYDARIEPAAQSGRDGAVAVFEGDEPVVQVDFHTAVRP